MTRRLSALIALALIAATGAAAPPAPTTNPAVQPETRPSTMKVAAKAELPQPRSATRPSTRPVIVLPKEFALFEKQNPFAHGPPPQLASAQMGPESTLVLKGVMDTSGKCIAFIEDTGSKRVMQVAAGQPVGRGMLKAVSLDAVEYEAMGNARKIMVGQNFNGQVVPPTPATKPAGPQPPPGAPGQPPGPPPGPGGPQPMPGRPAPARVVTAPR